ncbi:hypothetical protein J2D73_10795 [Acetobacter sacchari]|uniref:Uncharacterized protein n=1 Tax=Acetobacter sacchari TaxID=2661687 RepID=A0ABS3LWI5_9PROT|nr:hypothetical protein [Acetobacter sacchari]MBO1360274.1 hypothetical protein [Acetobacter sacchari]
MTASIECPTLRRPPLAAAGLTATKWDSAEDKARMGDAILSFIARGMPESAFTEKLYSRLSNMFGNIAHCDKNGFWQVQLSTTARRVAFLEQIATAPCWGQPGHTWCDVEREIKARICEQKLIPAYRAAMRVESERDELAQLARLQAKYGEAATQTAARASQARKAEQLGLL